MERVAGPKVLLVYYTYTRQSQRVAEAMAEALGERGREIRHQGGEYVDAIHFSFAGGQVRSLLSLFSYLGTGESRERCLGVRIPPTNLKPDYEVEARAFAHELADGFAGAGKRE
jgi:hypothetical protein